MATLPQDTSCQAEYADGFVLDETEHDDTSPYNPTQNILRAIINGDAIEEHGPMVRFSVFYKDARYDVAWVDLPTNARPIRFRDGFMTLDAYGNTVSGWSGVRFGYQYNDENGKNIQEIQEL